QLDRRTGQPEVARVLAARHELLAFRRGVERVAVRELPLRVVVVRRFSHRRAEDLAVPEDAVRHAPADLRVLRVCVGVRLSLVQHDHAEHARPPWSGRRERIASRVTRKEEGMAGQLVHFEVQAECADRAAAFYKTVFGWDFANTGMPGIDYRMTRTGDSQGGGLYQSDDRSGHLIVYFDTDDI